MTERNENENKQVKTGQKLMILDRKMMELTGVEDVISFDENGAALRTGLGVLAVDGEELHVIKLDLAGGVILFEGKINGLFYSDPTNAKNKAKRLFR